MACVGFGQPLQRHLVAEFFLVHPGNEGLLHDPAARPFELLGKLIHLQGKFSRHVRRQHTGFRFAPGIGLIFHHFDYI